MKNVVTAAQILKAEEFEICVDMKDLNKYGSWSFTEDFSEESVTYDHYDGDFYAWMENAQVRILFREGKSMYAVIESDGHSKSSQWDYQETGDDQGAASDIEEMMNDGIDMEVITWEA